MTDKELETALLYIRANCIPTDVFTREELIAWIAENEEPENVFPVRKLVAAVRYSKVEPV